MTTQLHVPAIGTMLILAEPWHFRLYFESRNSKLITALTGEKFGWWCNGDEHIDKKLGEYRVKLDNFGVPEDEEAKNDMQLASTWRSHRAMAYIDVCFPEKTVLTVDRIYIRKGVDAYNSLTFWVKKPAKLKKPKKGEPPLVPTPEYEFLTKVGGNRFWAKLPDVNQIVCEIV